MRPLVKPAHHGGDGDPSHVEKSRGTLIVAAARAQTRDGRLPPSRHGAGGTVLGLRSPASATAKPWVRAVASGIRRAWPTARQASPRARHGARPIGQQHAQQGGADFELPVVMDEALLAELVHEVADPRPCCADHLGERFLAELRDHRVRPAFLAEIGQQQPRQPLFRRVEQLIDEVCFDAGFPRQDVRDEHRRERRFFAQHALDLGLVQPHRLAFRDGGRRCRTLELPDQASFAQKFIRPEQRDHGFLALGRYDRKFDLALLDVKKLNRRGLPGKKSRPFSNAWKRSGRARWFPGTSPD